LRYAGAAAKYRDDKRRKEKPMARKPNYDFERKERERIKNEKRAAREKAKGEQPKADGDAPAGSAEEKR
jgi:hypothetical protein